MEYLIKDINKKVNLLDSVFNYKFNPLLIHQLINSYICSLKKGTKAQKNRGEVVGSNKKPWKQKGTGRARAGTVKSPIWRKGGVTFAAKPIHKYKKINKKMYKGAIKSIFSELIRQNKLILINQFLLKKPKTFLFINKIKLFSENWEINKICLLDDKLDINLILATRNLHKKINICSVKHIKLLKLINSKLVIITLAGIKFLEQYLV